MKNKLASKILKVGAIIGVLSLAAGAWMQNNVKESRAQDAEVGYVINDLEERIEDKYLTQELVAAKPHFEEMGIKFTKQPYGYDVYKLNEENEYELLGMADGDKYVEEWYAYAFNQAVENHPEIVEELKAEYAALGDKVYTMSPLGASALFAGFVGLGLGALVVNVETSGPDMTKSREEREADRNFRAQYDL